MTIVPTIGEEIDHPWYKLLQEAKQIADRIDRGEEKMISHEELKRLMLEKIQSGAVAHKTWQT
jgi:hypothetical protein